MKFLSLFLMLVCMVPLETIQAELPSLPASLQLDAECRFELQWEFQDADVEYLIYAVDESGERVPFACTRERSYPVPANIPQFEVEALRDGTVIASSGPIVAAYPNYTTDEWLQIAPYLLPNTHPVKPKLEKMFRKKRYISTIDTLKDGDFTVKGPGSGRTLVAKHKKLPDVLIKIFPDDEPIDELKQFMRRITGAQVAREIIAKYQLEWLFKVPRKWIYILPQEPKATGPYPKSLILIVEDMEILQKTDNYPKWKSSSMTKKKLDAVYILLQEGGFNDLALAFNLPFCKDGLLAVVDTEDYHKWPIPFNRLNKYLSDSMIKYWEELIAKGGPSGYRPNAKIRSMIEACALRPFTAPDHALTGSLE
ncbi:MAG: hypothetical protein ACK5MA_05020 [Parachlamydiaceae bacterium]